MEIDLKNLNQEVIRIFKRLTDIEDAVNGTMTETGIKKTLAKLETTTTVSK